MLKSFCFILTVVDTRIHVPEIKCKFGRKLLHQLLKHQKNYDARILFLRHSWSYSEIRISRQFHDQCTFTDKMSGYFFMLPFPDKDTGRSTGKIHQSYEDGSRLHQATRKYKVKKVKRILCSIVHDQASHSI